MSLLVETCKPFRTRTPQKTTMELWPVKKALVKRKAQISQVSHLWKIVGMLVIGVLVFTVFFGDIYPVIEYLTATLLKIRGPYEASAINSVDAITYATNCAALANAWNPDVVGEDNFVANKYEKMCSEADVDTYGKKKDGVLVGKKFGERGAQVTVQCQMKPSDPGSGCDVYNLTLPQNLKAQKVDGKPLKNILRKGADPHNALGIYENAYGDPNYLMYYQKFPRMESNQWRSNKVGDHFSMEIVGFSAVFGGVAGALGGMVGSGSAGMRTFKVSPLRTLGEVKDKMAEEGILSTTKNYLVYSARSGARSTITVKDEVVDAPSTFRTVGREYVEATGRKIDNVRTLFDDVTVPSEYLAYDSQVPLRAQSMNILFKKLDHLSTSHRSRVTTVFYDSLLACKGCSDEELETLFNSVWRYKYSAPPPSSHFTDALDAAESTGIKAIATNEGDLAGKSGLASYKAFIRSGNGYGSRFEITEEGFLKSLKPMVDDVSRAQRVKNILADQLKRQERMLKGMVDAVKNSPEGSRMSMSYASRVSKRLTAQIRALDDVDGGVINKMTDGSTYSRAQDWVDGDDALFGEEVTKPYLKPAAEDITGNAWEPRTGVDAIDPGSLSQKDATKIFLRARVTQTMDTLDSINSPAVRSLKQGKYIGKAAYDTYGGRLAFAEWLGESGFGQNWLEENEVTSLANCGAMGGLTSKGTCGILVALAIHHTRMVEGSDQFNYVGNNMAVDKNMQFVPPIQGDLIDEVNWFLPALPTPANADDYAADYGDEWVGGSLPFEHRFRLASPCYTDKIRIRHETMDGRWSHSESSRKGMNSPSYHPSPETKDYLNLLGTEAKTTMNSYLARKNDDGSNSYISKGVWTEDIEKNNVDVSYFYFSRGPMALMTGAEDSELENGNINSISPPGYCMIKSQKDTSDCENEDDPLFGNEYWHGLIEVEETGTLWGDTESGVEKVGRDYQVKRMKEILNKRLWEGEGSNNGYKDLAEHSRSETYDKGISKLKALRDDTENDKGEAILRGTIELLEKSEERYMKALRNATGEGHYFPLSGFRDQAEKGVSWKNPQQVLMGPDMVQVLWTLTTDPVNRNVMEDPYLFVTFDNSEIPEELEKCENDFATSGRVDMLDAPSQGATGATGGKLWECISGEFGEGSKAQEALELASGFLTQQNGAVEKDSGKVDCDPGGHYPDERPYECDGSDSIGDYNQDDLIRGQYDDFPYLSHGFNGNRKIFYKMLMSDLANTNTLVDPWVRDSNVYHTPYSLGVKTFQSSTADDKMRQKLNDIFSETFPWVDKNKFDDNLADAEVESLVYHLKKKDASEMDAISNSQNYCYSTSTPQEHANKKMAWYTFTAAGEIVTEAALVMFLGPVGAPAAGAVSGATWGALATFGTQHLEKKYSTWWPHADTEG